MKTVETRGKIMVKIIFALPESGHHRTLQDIVGHLCENPLTIRAKYDNLKSNKRLHIRRGKA